MLADDADSKLDGIEQGHEVAQAPALRRQLAQLQTDCVKLVEAGGRLTPTAESLGPTSVGASSHFQADGMGSAELARVRESARHTRKALLVLANGLCARLSSQVARCDCLNGAPPSPST